MWKYESGAEILGNTVSRTEKNVKTKTFNSVSVLNLSPDTVQSLDGHNIYCSVSNELMSGGLETSIRVELEHAPRGVTIVQDNSGDNGAVSVGQVKRKINTKMKINT